jgi:signal transduction histidine kinase
MERPVPQRETQGDAAKRRTLSPDDNPLVRAVGRVPAKVHTKLLVAFVATALLVVAVGVLGVRLLGQSNQRVDTLGELQRRSAAYSELGTYAEEVRLLLQGNLGGDFGQIFRFADRDAGDWAVDLSAVDTLERLKASMHPEYLGFVPPPEDEQYLGRIRETSTDLSRVMERIVRAGRAGREVEDADRLDAEGFVSVLREQASVLDHKTTERAEALIAQNDSAYTNSRNLFIGGAAGAIGLALLLGFVLSWSVIGPIQRIGARLSATASGDFTGRVDVTNRDELGALAANVNRMNDELRRLYKELEAASQHKSDFLASMSHELRTPLNAIIGFSQVLREGMVGDVNEKQREYLEDILSSGNHLLSLINDVLDLSKVEAGQVELDVAPFSLRDALESGVVMVRERATNDGVQITVAESSGVNIVEGDERRVRQVIFNLLSNAVKFTPPGGSVDVRTARVNGEVQVSVADTGPGIAARDLERIFEEFQQTEAGLEQREGTGLGLALSKRLVELHGGRIWVESEVGGGARSCSPCRRKEESDDRCGGPRRRGQREEHEAVPGRPRSDGLPHPGGDHRPSGGRARDRARPHSRAHGHPAPGHRRHRGARPAAGGQPDRVPADPRPDRAGDGG